MAAVGKGPHFLQKNPPAEFSGYGPVSDATIKVEYAVDGCKV